MVEPVDAEAPKAPPAPGEPRTSRRTILVAEDEPPLRRIIAIALRELGYDVVTAQDGVEAIRLFEELRGKIAMVLLDVVMPSLGGIQAYERMRVLDPPLKVMFMTGYAPDGAQLSGIVTGGGHPVLTKPFSIDELRRTIRATLDADM
jgi:CheY-like chemotaxis protein